jgi:hypothetical protein
MGDIILTQNQQQSTEHITFQWDTLSWLRTNNSPQEHITFQWDTLFWHRTNNFVFLLVSHCLAKNYRMTLLLFCFGFCYLNRRRTRRTIVRTRSKHADNHIIDTVCIYRKRSIWQVWRHQRQAWWDVINNRKRDNTMMRRKMNRQTNKRL